MEAELTERAQCSTDWPKCPKCGKRLHSKGLLPRKIMSIFGEISWKRRVGNLEVTIFQWKIWDMEHENSHDP
ncbi:hypothetical protein DRN43_05960 [Thermococci archaeon]|nr:MAG: hypothetical protein DRN43_05960 [Thermococci archaeon]